MSLGGHMLYEKGIGIHGRTFEQHRSDGLKEYAKGLGKRTAEQHSADGMKGGLKGTIAKGLTHLSEEEKKFA
jgi:hypothetical protein